MTITVEAGSGDGGGRVLACFRLSHVAADQVAVVGEFNGWSTTAHPMTREGAEFVARIELTPGRTYRFRYLLDGERWENDWDAHAYVPNEFGGDDSLIDLTVGIAAAPVVLLRGTQRDPVEGIGAQQRPGGEQRP